MATPDAAPTRLPRIRELVNLDNLSVPSLVYENSSEPVVTWATDIQQLEKMSQASWTSFIDESYPSSSFTPASSSSLAAAGTEAAMSQPISSALISSQASVPANTLWQSQNIPFLAVPPEIHLQIFRCLNPIDATCLSLVSRYIQDVFKSIMPRPHLPSGLQTGSPDSATPLPLDYFRSCKHCVPVLYYPTHCELHHHLRSFMPQHLTFCSGPCKKYTRCEQKGYSDSERFCGVCGVNYRRRYARGRRMLDVNRPGEKQLKLTKWYNGPE